MPLDNVKTCQAAAGCCRSLGWLPAGLRATLAYFTSQGLWRAEDYTADDPKDRPHEDLERRVAQHLLELHLAHRVSLRE